MTDRTAICSCGQLRCSSSVYWEGDMRPDITVVAVGPFRDPHLPAPVRAVWAEARHAWATLPSEWPVFAQGAGGHATKPKTPSQS